jgi:hypothetical protein
MLKLNSFYGRETSNLEFKEFCLKYNKNDLLILFNLSLSCDI